MKKKILSVILAFVLCFPGVLVSAEIKSETAVKYIDALVDVIDKNYIYGIEREELYKAIAQYLISEKPELLEGAFKAATDILDDYSVYYNSDELGNFVTNVHQSYVGIGVTVQKSENGCIVMEVNENGGAFKAGVCVGDEIVAIDGENILDKSIDDVVQKIKGAAETTVTLDILRNGTYLTLDVVRKKINLKTVAYDIIDDIGYIKIGSFAFATSEEIKEALDDIEEKHRLNKIIIDVRDNPGGELASVIKILNQFVPYGKTLVKFEYKNEKRNYEIKSEASFTRAPKREIVILTNEKSASASELFSGTMQHYKLAKIVGQRTFGKGSMQEMMGLVDPPGVKLGDLKLTLAEFLKPDGEKINKIGIKPDVSIKNKKEDFDELALTPMTISQRYTIGASHSDVLAIEERLYALGYFVGEIDGVYDNLTYQATKNFQASKNLFPYGVMDYTTQAALQDVIEELEVEIDTQLEKAIELLK